MKIVRSSRSPRWDFLGRYQVSVDGKLMLDRLRVIQTPWFAVLLTHILGPDADRDRHDHSRWFATCILRGGYTELVFKDPADTRMTAARTHARFSVMHMPVRWAHRITGVQPNTWTLVFAGRHHGTFRFWTPAGPVDWKKYSVS